MSQSNHRNYKHLSIIILLGFSLSSTLWGIDKLTIESKSNSQKYCLDQWEKECGKLRGDKAKFLKCTNEKTEAGCKSILTKMIKKEMSEQDQRTENLAKSSDKEKEDFLNCNTKLHKMCPVSEFPKDVDQAKCFQGKFKSLDKKCQIAIVKYFSKKRPSNKKPNQ